MKSSMRRFRGVLKQVGGHHHLVEIGDLQLDRLMVFVSLPYDDRAEVGDAK